MVMQSDCTTQYCQHLQSTGGLICIDLQGSKGANSNAICSHNPIKLCLEAFTALQLHASSLYQDWNCAILIHIGRSAGWTDFCEQINLSIYFESIYNIRNGGGGGGGGVGGGGGMCGCYGCVLLEQVEINGTQCHLRVIGAATNQQSSQQQHSGDKASQANGNMMNSCFLEYMK